MAGIYTHLVSGVLFPIHERLKRHSTVAVRDAMEKSQWSSPEQLQEFRIERLRKFLSDCKNRVPYYREAFSRLDFQPARIQSLQALQEIPFLTKKIIRDRSDALKSERAIGLSRFNTGGSSGEPLVFWIGRERVSHDVAAKWRATRWWDVDIGDPEIVVWGSPIELGGQDRIRAVRDKMLRTYLLPAFDMSESKLNGFIDQIIARRPKMLFGYPSVLWLIAQQAESSGKVLDNLGIKVAFVTSERLYDHQREKISSIFGCPVANGYGGRDAGFIAHQCPAGGMHITAEDIIVEIVDADGRVLPPGETGEVVVTHMATSDFPFIRYRTGDVAALDEKLCSCGRSLPLLKQIEGRTTDFLVAQDGTIMHGLALVYVVRDVEGIENFKIIQESQDLTRIQIEVNPRFQTSDRKVIAAGVKKRLGEKVEIKIEQLDKIPAEKSGKYRYVVSHVGQPSAHGCATTVPAS